MKIIFEKYRPAASLLGEQAESSRRAGVRCRVLVLCLLLLSSFVLANPEKADVVPEQLTGITIDQNLGAIIPLDLTFQDEDGEKVLLRDYFGRRPVILTLVYYECPMLCNMILNGSVRAFRALEFTAGKEFEVVSVSIDPRETPAQAAAKKSAYVEHYSRPGVERGWHFLTGQEGQIQALAEAAGFQYRYDPASGQYTHAAGIMVLTPAGKLARYFYGVEYSARDLRLALVEAAEERIGSVVDQVLLFCFHYDPVTGKYSLAILRTLRIAGVLTLFGIGLLVFVLFRKERRDTVSPADY